MNVEELMKDVCKGATVLPDFQRSFIWEPEDVRELIVSVLGNYFIGSMLILEQFRNDSLFALRLVEGVKEINKDVPIKSIVKIILDGQQRTTALFYALYELGLPLKNRKNPYKFYLDIGNALKENWDDAVIGVSTRDKRKLHEISTKDDIVPFSLLKDVGEVASKFRDHPDFKKIVNLANNFMQYSIHTVSLPRDTSLEKIVETFERINRTGEPLSVFELLTARLYKDGIKLRDILKSTKEEFNFSKYVKPELILKTIALMRSKEPKRRNLLKLNHTNFKGDWEKASQSLEDAYRRVMDIRSGYGVLDFKKWMPYTTMLVPLAAMLHFLKNSKIESPKNYEKIDSWYWISIFSNRYDQAVDTASATDFKVIKEWLNDDNKIPEFIKKFDFSTIDLDVDKQGSATYRGVINLIVLAGALDFETGLPPQFRKEKIQDDHIFPKSIYKEHRVANRTLISTNAKKGDKKPSEYFEEMRKKHGEAKLKEILKTHLIPEDALDTLLKDDLNNFMKKRRLAIVEVLKEKVALLKNDANVRLWNTIDEIQLNRYRI